MKALRLSDRLLPRPIVTGDTETHRRGVLIVYATAFATLTPIPVALILMATGDNTLALHVLAGALPSAATLLVLRLSKSTLLAGNYLTAWVFLQTAVDFGHDNGFSMLAIIAVPILACAMISERAAIIWICASIAWVVSIGVQVSPADPLYFGLVWSTAIVVGVIGFATLVLDRTRAQARAASEEAIQELSHQRERLRAFAENTFPAIAETTGDRMLFASEGVEQVLGYKPEDFAQHALSQYVHPDDLPAIRQQLAQARISGMHYEARMRHAQGHWVWLEVFAIPYGPGQDRWLFAARNIESEKQQREFLQQSQRLESVGMLAAGVAHDFNNLLTVITGFTELSEEGEAKEEVLRATAEAAKLTRQLTSFAKADQRGPAATDVSTLIQDLRPMLKGILGSSINFSVEGATPNLFAAITPGQLHQVMLNITTNAKTAMPDGGDLKIAVSKRHINANSLNGEDGLDTGTYVQIDVSDTGYGMDAYTQQHAFDPFFSTKEKSRQSGLGLASVYGIVKNLGGLAKLKSREGEGTQVTIILPVAAAGVPESPLQPEKTPFQAANAQIGQTILVVEQDVSVRYLLVDTLERAGYCVESAKSGSEALDITNTLEPHLLICDSLLAQHTRVPWVKRMREKFPELGVLYLGTHHEQSSSEWHEPNHQRFLAKPYRASDLINSVKVMVARGASHETES